jgi:hypothetical protein
VFPVDTARTILKQCSRVVPKSVQDVWLPTPELIRQVELALAPPLQKELDRVSPSEAQRVSAGDYYRQYAGVVIAGQRMVYINGFHRSYLEMGSLKPPLLDPGWRRIAVNVCDGWRRYFGAEYDPVARKVRNIRFNGRS